jgi:hypothetical protein
VKGTDHYRELGIDGKIILKRILKNEGVGLQTGLKTFNIRSGACERGSELSGSIKGR